MNVRSLILTVAALFVAAMTAIIARNLMSSDPESTPVPAVVKSTKTRILVAAQPLPVGRILQPVDLKWQDWPEDAVAPNYLVEGQATPEAVAGKVVRVAILPNQPVAQDAIVGPNDRGFLAAVLAPGMRGVTMPISVTSGVGGFIFPGDRVDLLMTHDVNRGGTTVSVTETVIRNVRVLAIDQGMVNPENKPRVGSTATIEVTPKQAEKIAVMHRVGGISLSLRPLTDHGNTVTEDNQIELAVPTDTLPTYTTASEVTRFGAARPVASGGGRPAGRAPSAAPNKGVVIVVRGSTASVAQTGAN